MNDYTITLTISKKNVDEDSIEFHATDIFEGFEGSEECPTQTLGLDSQTPSFGQKSLSPLSRLSSSKRKPNETVQEIISVEDDKSEELTIKKTKVFSKKIKKEKVFSIYLLFSFSIIFIFIYYFGLYYTI